MCILAAVSLRSLIFMNLNMFCITSKANIFDMKTYEVKNSNSILLLFGCGEFFQHDIRNLYDLILKTFMKPCVETDK